MIIDSLIHDESTEHSESVWACQTIARLAGDAVEAPMVQVFIFYGSVCADARRLQDVNGTAEEALEEVTDVAMTYARAAQSRSLGYITYFSISDLIYNYSPNRNLLGFSIHSTTGPCPT